MIRQPGHVSRETTSVVSIEGLSIHTVPKCATASIVNAMKRANKKMMYPDDLSDNYRWMCVRHPFDRIVSAWEFFCHTDIERLTGNLSRLGYRNGMKFNAFVKLLIKVHDEDRHTCQQSYYVGPYKIDKIVRLEQLPVEWKFLQLKFPLLRNPLENIHRTNHLNWISYPWTKGQMKSLKDIFANDLALYRGIQI